MIAEIEMAETRRRAAMVAGDVEALMAIIDEDALYVHTNGLRETGPEFLELVRSGTYRYADVNQPEMIVRMLAADVAVVTGRTILHAIIPDNSIKVVDGRSVVIWARRGGEWRMQHYQGTLF
ncbi:nuclear transport factor 2 family protein [Rhizorhabdus argentea]|uniref:nuclear transport factor 2 family protein n=1 Tax=Rhizorhabdus argentea TaxID=1387174 RepID=UPI0030EF56F6